MKVCSHFHRNKTIISVRPMQEPTSYTYEYSYVVWNQTDIII
jgi:hypothetical protein